MNNKKVLSKEAIYKKNQKKSKICRTLSPIVFWSFIVISILCMFVALRNSFGNVIEIMDWLNGKKFNDVQLAENYEYLIAKYGEWVIGNGTHGFVISFVDIGNAVFSGVAITNFVMSIAFYISAYVIGKWTLPRISAQLLIDNQDMVNLVILKDHESYRR